MNPGICSEKKCDKMGKVKHVFQREGLASQVSTRNAGHERDSEWFCVVQLAVIQQKVKRVCILMINTGLFG